jgi:hypothetical protein
MSTRCEIIVQTQKKPARYKAVYCHWDGYPDGAGKTLLNHYGDRDKILRLVSMGDMSVLGGEIDPNPNKPHTFESPQENVCVFYRRDENQKDEPMIFGGNEFCLGDLRKVNCGAEWQYLFRGGRWLCRYVRVRRWDELETLLKEQE